MKLTTKDLELIENTLQERVEKIRSLPAYHYGVPETHDELDRVKDTLNRVEILITREVVDQ